MTPDSVFELPAATLDRIMPMHICLSTEGRILGAGPTLLKIARCSPLRNAMFFDLFQVRRPGGIACMSGLRQRVGARLHLHVACAPTTGLRGIAMPGTDGGIVINMSFGIDLAEAVRRHALTDADFAPTDLAVELLYLVEAKTAVLEELGELNRRLQGAKAEAEEQALTDTLTGLRNRRAMDTELADLIDRGRPFGIMHVDLDYFKQVNDTLGHAAGDHVLQHVAHVLNAETRDGDMVARVGGDEFVVVFPGLVSGPRLDTIAGRIIDRLSQPVPFGPDECRISASIGMALSTDYTNPQPDRMLSDADRALYASKNAGRARATLFRA